MKASKWLMALLLVLATASGARASSADTAGPGTQVLGFQQWKASRVEEARTILERLQLEAQVDKAPSVERAPGEKGAPAKGDKKADAAKVAAATPRGPQESMRLHRPSRGDQRLQQAQLNLEIAREFTVNDYFVLYLSQFQQKEAFLEAAKKLTPEESADLMMAYQKALNGSNHAESVSPPSSLSGVSSLPQDKASRTGL